MADRVRGLAFALEEWRSAGGSTVELAEHLIRLIENRPVEHVCACGHKFFGPPDVTQCLACEYP